VDDDVAHLGPRLLDGVAHVLADEVRLFHGKVRVDLDVDVHMGVGPALLEAELFRAAHAGHCFRRASYLGKEVAAGDAVEDLVEVLLGRRKAGDHHEECNADRAESVGKPAHGGKERGKEQGAESKQAVQTVSTKMERLRKERWALLFFCDSLDLAKADLEKNDGGKRKEPDAPIEHGPLRGRRHRADLLRKQRQSPKAQKYAELHAGKRLVAPVTERMLLIGRPLGQLDGEEKKAAREEIGKGGNGIEEKRHTPEEEIAGKLTKAHEEAKRHPPKDHPDERTAPARARLVYLLWRGDPDGKVHRLKRICALRKVCRASSSVGTFLREARQAAISGR